MLACTDICAQNISVASFKLLPSDLTANTNGTEVLDQNGEKAALIKVVTTQMGFTFEGGALGITKVKQESGEIWVYVPQKSKKITVKHQQLGVIRDYIFPCGIEAARTYEMVLVTGKTKTIVEHDDGMTYFSLIVTPINAVVFIDDVMNTLDDDGTLTLRLPRGRHTYRVSATGFDTSAASFDLGKNKKVEKVRLVSNMAKVTIMCPTSNSQIFINEVLKGFSPWSGTLKAGNYLIEARLDGYNTSSSSVAISEKENKTITLPELIAKVGKLDVNYKPIESEVYIDGNKVGTSPDVFDNLIVGTHKIRIKANGYTDNIETVDISEGQTTSISGSLAEQKNSETLTTNGAKVFTVKDVSFIMLPVEAGSFIMGATPEMENPDFDERPPHHRNIRRFFLGQTEVTQHLWKAIMDDNPSQFKGKNLPVTNVSWTDCMIFLSKLNSITGKKFRLPTEAEWEFSARGGNKSNHTQYSGSHNIIDVAWFYDNSKRINPVAKKMQNELGLYDMSGNVWEWCSDFFIDYTNMNNDKGTLRVFRGGSWNSSSQSCRSSKRNHAYPDFRNNELGLRLCLDE